METTTGKTRSRWWLLLLAVVTGAFLAGCGTGNDAARPASATLLFTASTGATPTPAAATGAQPLAMGPGMGMMLDDGGSIVFTALALAAEDLRLEQAGQTAGEAGVVYPGPYIIDVLTGTVTDAAGDTVALSAMIPPGLYDGLALRLSPQPGLDPGTSNPRSVYAVLTYTDASAVTRTVTFSLASTAALEIEGPNGFGVDGGNVQLMLDLRLQHVFTAQLMMALADNAPDTGDIVITDAELDAWGLSFLERLRLGMAFGRDRNRDGMLGDSEHVGYMGPDGPGGPGGGMM